MTCNTAVFYDVENLLSLFNGRANRTLQLDEIHKHILSLDVVNGISVQRAYADWMSPISRSLRSYILQIGIEPIQIFNTNPNDKIKNAADVSLIIDALDLLIKRPEIENFCVASGDGIFAFLAKKLHEYGKRVIGVSFERSSNIFFKNSCDIFVPIDRLERPDAAKSTILVPPEEEPKENLHPVRVQIHSDASPQGLQPKELKPKELQSKEPQKEAPLKIPNKLPKNKFTEDLVRSGVHVFKKGADLSSTLHHMKKIVNILFSGTGNTEVEISLFKAYVAHFLPNFRGSQYGFKRFGEFMRFFLTASPYRLAMTDGGTTVKIVRRDNSFKGAILEDVQDLSFTAAGGAVHPSVFDIEEGAFTFEITKKTPVPAKPLYVKPAAVQPDASPKAARTDSSDDGSQSIRKWIKEHFARLSKQDKLTGAEVKRLTNGKYSLEKFSAKTPIFKTVDRRTTIAKQRMVDGRPRYWKDIFEFKGKGYLIYKEWDERVHRNRLNEWLEKVDK